MNASLLRRWLANRRSAATQPAHAAAAGLLAAWAWAASVMAACLAAGGCSQQPLPLEGNEPLLWGFASVVYAEVVSIEPGDQRGRLRVTLDVQATLSGELDAAAAGRMEVAAASSLAKEAAAGAQVVAVLWRQADGTYEIPTAPVAFMPNGRALAVVESLDDEAIGPLTARLRELRKTADPPSTATP